MIRNPKSLAALAALLFLGAAAAIGSLAIDWYSVAAGGNRASATSDLELFATIGQPGVGVMSGGTFELAGGFCAAAVGYEVVDCNGNGVADHLDIANVGAAFTETTSWAAFDPGDNGVGTDPDGYTGAVYDGRYVYFVPDFNGTEMHGEVLRYDTVAPFDDPAAWATYDHAGLHDGYIGGVFDGRYVYFVPCYGGDEVLRYDTSASFFNPAAWVTANPADYGAGTPPLRYWGAVFDNDYLYFVPVADGEVLRHDTLAGFTNPAAWEAFDPGDHGIGTDPDGYWNGTADGRYVYFAPYDNGTEKHGEVLRYDQTEAFTSPASWSTCDPGLLGIGIDPDGYSDAVFDGRYVYFAPFDNGGARHGEVLRYDTTGDFAAAGSWATFDAGDHGVGSDPDGYIGAVFDGRYVLFVPHSNGTENHGEVLRYDTTAAFDQATSWAAFDAGANGIGTDPDGYNGAAFDGHYVYFSPNDNGGMMHGEVLRCDALAGGSPDRNGNGVPDECEVGDMDCDGDVDFDDINPFVLALGGQAGYLAAYPGCLWENADCNGDGLVDFDDINAFVTLLGS